MKAKELQSGLKVRMGDDSVKTVNSIGRGFARIGRDDEIAKQAVMINWCGGDWSQVHPETEVTLIL